MRVAKYWRNKKLRYRLIMTSDGASRRRARSASKAGKDPAREREVGIERAKALA